MCDFSRSLSFHFISQLVVFFFLCVCWRAVIDSPLLSSLTDCLVCLCIHTQCTMHIMYFKQCYNANILWGWLCFSFHISICCRLILFIQQSLSCSVLMLCVSSHSSLAIHTFQRWQLYTCNVHRTHTHILLLFVWIRDNFLYNSSNNLWYYAVERALEFIKMPCSEFVFNSKCDARLRRANKQTIKQLLLRNKKP